MQSSKEAAAQGQQGRVLETSSQALRTQSVSKRSTGLQLQHLHDLQCRLTKDQRISTVGPHRLVDSTLTMLRSAMKAMQKLPLDLLRCKLQKNRKPLKRRDVEAVALHFSTGMTHHVDQDRSYYLRTSAATVTTPTWTWAWSEEVMERPCHMVTNRNLTTPPRPHCRR
jgi:hypothetical protein